MAKPRKSTGSEAKPTAKALPVRFEVTDKPAVFATNAVVQFDKHEFRLRFYQIDPPMLLGDEDDRRQQLETMEAVNAREVAHLVITRERFAEILRVMEKNYVGNVGPLAPEAEEDSDAT